MPTEACGCVWDSPWGPDEPDYLAASYMEAPCQKHDKCARCGVPYIAHGGDFDLHEWQRETT